MAGSCELHSNKACHMMRVKNQSNLLILIPSAFIN